VGRGWVGFVLLDMFCYNIGTLTIKWVHKEKQMKAYKPTRKVVDTLLDNPLGNIFLVNALQRYADEVIKYASNLPDDAPQEIVSPQALARTAEELKIYMNQTFK
jgi:hypothetical protein